jgi:hypothetical protein
MLTAARRLPLWKFAAAVAVLTWLQMVRRPSDPPLWDSLYVEDGGTFFNQALNAGFLDTLATSHYGYLHTVPRAIAEAASLAPLEGGPLAMSLLTCLAAAAIAAYVFAASGAWLASPLLRTVLAVAVVFVPVTARDLTGTVGNLHWYLVYGAAWAVICPWRSRGWLGASATVVLAAALSDPLTGLLLPLAIAIALRARIRVAWVLPATIAGGLLVQLVLGRDDPVESFGGSDWEIVPRLFAERVTSSLLVGDRYLEDAFGGQTGSPFAWLSLAVVAVAVAAGLWGLRGRRRWLLGGCVALALAFFAVAVFGRGTDVWLPEIPWELGASRYTYLPVLFLVTGLFAAVDSEPGRRWRPRALEVAAALLVVATMVSCYRLPHRTEGHIGWDRALALARASCADGRARSPVVLDTERGVRIARVPISGGYGWHVPVRCSRLD